MDREIAPSGVPKNLQFRVGLLVGLAVVLGAGFVIYALYARGVFEDTQHLTLMADNGEGVDIGMDLTFSGFPIGRVKRLALDEQGRARIQIDVPRSDAHWLRESTIFTLERGLVGAARIRAYSANLRDPPLPDGAVRNVLRGDTQEEIPRMVATLRSTLENVEQLTASGGELQTTLGNVRALSERTAATVERVNTLLASVDSLVGKTNSLVLKTDQRLFAPGGVVDGTAQAVEQLNALLASVRDSLKRADAILADAQATSGQAKAASADLAALRAEVDSSVRKISGLIDEINRKWPFERKSEIRLP
jgi:phospholipid/cholesterol/gamma-HCH transport system substrate-binding protein